MAKDVRSTRSIRSSAEPTSSKSGKALKPLTSILGGRGGTAASSSGTSGSSARPANEKPKVTKTKASSSKSVTAAASTKAPDAIELSSDDEIEDLPNGNASDESDDDIVVTGQSGPSRVASTSESTGKNAPSSASKKLVSANKQATAKVKPLSTTDKDASFSPPLSEKAKGKQRAVQDMVTLEVADQREGTGVPAQLEEERNSQSPASDALWSDKYAPVDLAGLSVHPKKVADVRGWLEAAYAGGAVSKYRVGSF